jgi:hypothetical protein
VTVENQKLFIAAAEICQCSGLGSQVGSALPFIFIQLGLFATDSVWTASGNFGYCGKKRKGHYN